MGPHVARKGELFGGPNPPVPPSGPNALNVALYPYVPSPQAYVAAIQHAWQVHPDITLTFVAYDPYNGPPDPNIDVFAFDCIFADDLYAGQHLEPIGWSEVDAPEDLLPFASEAAYIDTNLAAGIPYLGCTNVLYYYLDDPELGNSNPLGVRDLYDVLGVAGFPGPQPLPGIGLIMDMGGKTTDACLYAGMWREANGAWWPQPFPTTLPPDLDPGAMTQMTDYADMTGQAGALYEDDSGHDRTNWFQSGLGRAFVGLTETMSGWSPEFLARIGFRPLPTAASGNATHILCYADALAIRPGLGDKRAVAVALANVAASTAVGVAALTPSPTAQYLMPARSSVLSDLALALPQYAAIGEMLASASPSPFRLGPGVTPWARPTGAAIIAALFDVAEEDLPKPALRHPRHHTTPAGMWRRGE